MFCRQFFPFAFQSFRHRSAVSSSQVTKSCCVFGCTSHAGRDKGISFYRLPLSSRPLLKKWLRNMRTKTVLVNEHTRVCGLHFENKKKSGPYDVPTIFPFQKKRKVRSLPWKQRHKATDEWGELDEPMDDTEEDAVCEDSGRITEREEPVAVDWEALTDVEEDLDAYLQGQIVGQTTADDKLDVYAQMSQLLEENKLLSATLLE